MEKSYCYYCNRETNCEQIFETDELIQPKILVRNDNGDENKYLYTIELHTISICKCLGCGRLHVVHSYNGININKNKEKNERIYTDPPKQEFKLANFVQELPIEYFKLFVQINKALNEEMYWLACIGIRTILDTYMTSILGDNGGFNQKIKTMRDKGFITNNQHELLEVVIDAGNASAHRGYTPTKETMKQIMQIVNNIFENTILDRKAKSIIKEVPKRNETKNESEKQKK